jgi:hypothetical protein
VDHWDLGVPRDVPELSYELGTEPSRSKQSQTGTLDGNQHATSCLDDREPLGEHHGRHVLDRLGLRKRSRYLEESRRTRGNAANFIIQALELGRVRLGARRLWPKPAPVSERGAGSIGLEA